MSILKFSKHDLRRIRNGVIVILLSTFIIWSTAEHIWPWLKMSVPIWVASVANIDISENESQVLSAFLLAITFGLFIFSLFQFYDEGKWLRRLIGPLHPSLRRIISTASRYYQTEIRFEKEWKRASKDHAILLLQTPYPRKDEIRMEIETERAHYYDEYDRKRSEKKIRKHIRKWKKSR